MISMTEAWLDQRDQLFFSQIHQTRHNRGLKKCQTDLRKLVFGENSKNCGIKQMIISFILEERCPRASLGKSKATAWTLPT